MIRFISINSKLLPLTVAELATIDQLRRKIEEILSSNYGPQLIEADALSERIANIYLDFHQLPLALQQEEMGRALVAKRERLEEQKDQVLSSINSVLLSELATIDMQTSVVQTIFLEKSSNKNTFFLEHKELAQLEDEGLDFGELYEDFSFDGLISTEQLSSYLEENKSYAEIAASKKLFTWLKQQLTLEHSILLHEES